ncbi:MAG: arginyltransferase [Bryobacteraceae bacterium]|nr:arginyltransferase [Bryobacteraceae bacterium]
MLEFARIIEPPRPCSYLPAETASLEYRLVESVDPEEYEGLLERGYRRFGHYLFRPQCPACEQCRSLRVPVQRFQPGASFRRVLAANRGVQAQLERVFITDEHVRLYNRYHGYMAEHRGWPAERATARLLQESFADGSDQVGRQWLFMEEGRLLGVAFMDETPRATSLAYCFYDPALRRRSLGTFSILAQLEYARRMRLRYVYLGYWIEASRSMSYKARFRPHEILRAYPRDGEAPVWDAEPDPAPIASL